MGGGGIKQSENQLAGISAQQLSEGSTLFGEGQQFIGQGQADISQLQNVLQGIVGGNSTQTNQAIAPLLGNISRTSAATKEKIMDTTAPGAGRDVLLGQVQLGQGQQVAGATNQAYESALQGLGTLGQGQVNAGLGLSNSGIGSTSNAATTTNAILNAQEQQKASAMQAFTGIAGIAGNLATKGISPSWFSGG
jgi:hypothetical protein